ncbi:MAG: transglycosylase SLT domain-containing protein [bacterium]|nr:transglycosylase SLT domain-containing protein [bacterium]
MRQKKNLLLVVGLFMALMLTDSVTHRQSVYGSSVPNELIGEVRDYLPFIKQLEATQGVEADLILGVMKTESEFNPRAVSPAGAMGLMQLMPMTAQGEYERVGSVPRGSDFFRRQLLGQPDLNIYLGVQHLSELHRIFAGVTDDVRRRALVVVTYNSGFRRVKSAFGCYTLSCVAAKADRYNQSQFEHVVRRLPRETRNYLVSVTENAQNLRIEYGLK